MFKSFFQTDAWGQFKAESGWQAERAEGLLQLSRRLPTGKFLRYYAELPWDETTLAAVKKISEQPVDPKVIFSRFEFLEPYTAPKAVQLIDLNLLKSFEEVQPEYRQWLSLESSEEELLTQMKPKCRYNIGVAERSELAITHGGAELAKDFYYLYQVTSKRTKFRGRGLAYLERLMALIDEQKIGEIILVKKFDATLAAGIFLYYEGLASYLYGGSSGDRSLMAPYLLHWEAIKAAKKRGCQTYDFLAVAPPDQPHHPYAGLSRFKSQFGGETVQLVGSWDLVHQPTWYRIFKMLEQLRRKKS